MLLNMATLHGISEGHITLAFRRWRRPTVKAGGQLKTAVGVLKFESVDEIEPDDISASDARKAGFESAAEVLQSIDGREGVLYRIRFHLGGADPRIALREQSVSDAEWDKLAKRIQRLVWAPHVLETIRAHPGTRAADLADMLGFEKMWLKINVRKLKNLGLTESLGTGYRVSPRGLEVLKRLRA